MDVAEKNTGGSKKIPRLQQFGVAVVTGRGSAMMDVANLSPVVAKYGDGCNKKLGRLQQRFVSTVAELAVASNAAKSKADSSKNYHGF